MNVLITGVTGFVGSALAKELVENGDTVVGIVRDLTKAFETLDRNVTVTMGDICNYPLVERVLSEYGIEAVYHLAAQSIVKKAEVSPISTFETNILGTWNMLEASRRCGVHAFLYASTDKVYGDLLSVSIPKISKVSIRVWPTEDAPERPTGIYEVSKLCADKLTQAYAKHYGLPAVVSRACNIYGLGDTNPRIIPNTICQCIAGQPPIIYKGVDYKREYIYIDDVLDAYLQLVENIDITAGEAFNVGSGETATQEEIVGLVLKHFPALKPRYVEPQEYMRREIKDQCLDSKKIRGVLGWEARVELTEGIRRTVEWWQSSTA